MRYSVAPAVELEPRVRCTTLMFALATPGERVSSAGFTARMSAWSQVVI